MSELDATPAPPDAPAEEEGAPQPVADGAATDAEDVDVAAAEAAAVEATGDPDVEATSDEAAAAVEVDIDLARTAAERDEYLDALRRLQADFENYKKRMVRQQTELLERAGESLVEKLLPVLDAIDLARQHGAAEGVEQIATALVEALGKEGLERIDPVGEAFDPTEHEAVLHEPAAEGADGDGQVVSTLLRAGYRWRGRLVRPAMVGVKG